MDGRALLVSLAVGLLSFVAVAVAVTALLAERIWPSALVGLPAGAAVGLGAFVATFFYLRWRATRRGPADCSA